MKVRSHLAPVVEAGPEALSEFTDAFWARVAKAGPSECWLWQGARDAKGYGRLCWRGRPMTAHRIALELKTGPITDGRLSCHRCDNPPCCNPAHLWPGTQGENIDDAYRKGRMVGARGELAGNAKLCAFRVRLIRSSAIETGELAKLFGISKAQAHTVRVGQAWHHVDPETLPPRPGHQTREQRAAEEAAYRKKLSEAAKRRWARQRAATVRAAVERAVAAASTPEAAE